jgi:hypothetical protein
MRHLATVTPALEVFYLFVSLQATKSRLLLRSN